MTRCERQTDGNRCKRPAVAFAQGQHVCAEHDPPGHPTCSHSLAPAGRCAYCGATTEARP